MHVPRICSWNAGLKVVLHGRKDLVLATAVAVQKEEEAARPKSHATTVAATPALTKPQEGREAEQARFLTRACAVRAAPVQTPPRRGLSFSGARMAHGRIPAPRHPSIGPGHRPRLGGMRRTGLLRHDAMHRARR